MGRKNVEEGKLMMKLDSTRHLLTIAISIVSISYLLSANAHYNLRAVYYDQAITEYQRAIQINPNDAHIHVPQFG